MDTTPTRPASVGIRPSQWLFLVFWAASLLVFWKPVQVAVALSLESEMYSYITLIPLISIALLYLHREAIFQQTSAIAWLGIPLVGMTALFGWMAWRWSPVGPPDARLYVPILQMAGLWVMAFVVLNGPKACAAALFPLSFLMLMVPVPAWMLERAVVFLQEGSTDAAYLLFKAVGVPVVRHGFVLSLPGLNIEVAEACSGIHSAVALLLVGMLAAHLFLRATWKQVLFTLLAIPVAILKNGVRIVTLSWLGIYVDRSILNGPLHHRGGSLFALIGIAMLVPILLLFRRGSKKTGIQPKAVA